MRQVKFSLALAALAVFSSALADDVPRDGQWRGDGGAALSISSGNSNSRSLNLNGNAARLTATDKLALYGQILEGRSEANGVTTTSANQWSAGGRYDSNFSPETFGFGGLDLSHDQLKQLSLRSVLSVGLGYHVIKTADNQFDVFGGAAYRNDQYSGAGVIINNAVETSFSTPQLMLGEESHHKLTESTTFQQKLAISPNLNNDKGSLVTFNSSLMVAMSKTLSLNVTLQDRYDSLSEPPLKKNDILFFTGVNMKFGG
jgi:putative salt-induced outer membrane protein